MVYFFTLSQPEASDILRFIINYEFYQETISNVTVYYNILTPKLPLLEINSGFSFIQLTMYITGQFVILKHYFHVTLPLRN